MKTITLIITIVLTYCSTAQVDPWTITTLDSIWLEGPHIDTGSTSPPPTASGDTTIPKLVFWIHGLAGGEASWGHVNDATYDQDIYPVSGYPERNMEGCINSYSEFESFTLKSVANKYIDKVELWRSLFGRDTLDPMKNIAIAHSQGGLVARAMRHSHFDPGTHKPAQFNALATFGSPHGGAAIINNSHPTTGITQPWIERGCAILVNAEFNSLVDDHWLIGSLISPGATASFSNTLCTGLGDLVLPILISSIRKDVGNSYAIGSPYLPVIDSIAEHVDTMPVVTFYGVEEEPVMWRVLHSMTKVLDTITGVGILNTSPFGLTNDDGLPQQIDNLISDYRAKAIDARNQCNWNDRQWFYNGIRSKQYMAAGHWLSQANMYWKRIIGARRDSSYANGYICNCISGVPYWVSDPADCGNDPMNQCVAMPNIKHYIIEEPSDGVVPVSSQIAYPGAEVRKRMDNTNHMQERNCEKTKDRLNELFNGEHGTKFILYRK